LGEPERTRTATLCEYFGSDEHKQKAQYGQRAANPRRSRENRKALTWIKESNRHRDSAEQSNDAGHADDGTDEPEWPRPLDFRDSICEHVLLQPA